MHDQSAVIWSKNGCPFCTKAKDLLEQHNIPYEERNLSNGNWSKDQLLTEVPNAKTVPQVFLGQEHVGGYTHLEQYFKTAEVTNAIKRS